MHRPLAAKMRYHTYCREAYSGPSKSCLLCRNRMEQPRCRQKRGKYEDAEQVMGVSMKIVPDNAH